MPAGGSSLQPPAATRAATATAPHMIGSSKKPGVEERVEEEHEEDDREAQPERTPSLGRLDEEAHGACEKEQVQREADHSELGEDGQRRRVRRVLVGRPARLHFAAGGEWLAADAGAHDGMVPDHGRRQRDEPRASARRPSEPGVLRRHEGERAAKDREGDRDRDHEVPAAPVGEQDRRREQRHEEDDHARLRVREVEAAEEDGDEDECVCQAHARKPEQHDEQRDREHEMSAVDARVLEQRRHAEVRRVRVRDTEVLGEDQRVRPGLVEADRREERCEAD